MYREKWIILDSNVGYRRKSGKLSLTMSSIFFTQIHASGIYLLVSIRSLQIYYFRTMKHMFCVSFLNESKPEG